MFGRGNNHRKNCRGKGRCKGGSKRKHRHHHPHFTLSEATENNRYIIKHNPNKQTIEMGISAGSLVFVHKNDPNESNIIVGVGEKRLIVPRDSARKIMVR